VSSDWEYADEEAWELKADEVVILRRTSLIPFPTLTKRLHDVDKQEPGQSSQIYQQESNLA
jgi:hypothetical protein